MKRLNFILGLLVLLFACCEDDYNFDPNFTAPTELTSPKSVKIDVSSTIPLTFSWSGGGAADGGIVLYKVLFDKADGDFTNPIAEMKGDLGAEPQLTITQSELNTIARKSGIKPDETGVLKWTVIASKGGDTKNCTETAQITVTRGEGIDNIPSELYLFGSATENGAENGQKFREVSEGVFCIYSKLSSGDFVFRSSNSNDGFSYFVDDKGKLREGDTNMPASPSDDISRITVDFNSLSMKIDHIGQDVRCIWGATYNNIAVCSYIGNGKFVGDGDIKFVQQSRPETMPPSWLSWVEERYYFIAKVNGADVCWGRGDDVSPERPTGGEPLSFYQLHEFGWSQWDHLWKMSGSLDMQHATITIDTNLDNMMVHTFTNLSPIN
ncbi:MAG: SusE domain-containing protein [Prevotella sp.]|jgi:hypothetical protein